MLTSTTFPGWLVVVAHRCRQANRVFQGVVPGSAAPAPPDNLLGERVIKDSGNVLARQSRSLKEGHSVVEVKVATMVGTEVTGGFTQKLIILVNIIQI